MKLIDLITIIGLIIGLFLVIAMHILLKRKKIRAESLPRILGIGTWVYGFTSLMATCILLRPRTEFMNYTIESLFWSLPLGVIAYFSGRKFARNMPD